MRTARRGRRGPPTCSTASLAAFVLAAALAALAAGTPMSERVVCHVCGGRAMLPGLPPPLDCRDGQDAPRECPANYKGCLTTYDGSTLTRTCGESAYNPCEVLNNIVYCYCSGRLCNAQTEEQMRQQRCAGLRRPQQAPEDDEDAAVDGSGSGELPDPDCLAAPSPTNPGMPADPVPVATTATPKDIPKDVTSNVPGDGDDLDWGSTETSMEGNATATGNTTDTDTGGDGHRAASSASCVLVAALVALSGWRLAES